MVKSIAIAGIHTGIGKTVASAVLAESLNADYWKPVQAGNDERDSVQVRQLLSKGEKRVHPEELILSRPMSPHAAAAIDGVNIDFKTFKWPETDKKLLVETAGGLLSPMSGSTTMADFITHYELPVILIVQNYLGSINHTLLTLEVLRVRNIRLLGIVINGSANESSETFIENYAGAKIIARIPQFEKLDNNSISKCAAEIKQSLLDIAY